MAEVSRLCFPEMDMELEICDEKMRTDFDEHKTYFYHSLNGRSYVISDERVDITDKTHNAAVPIQAADFMVAASTTTLLGLKSQIYTRVTSGSVADYIDGLANGNYMLDVRQGVTDLPTTSHLECIVHKLDAGYVTVLATDLYGNIFTRRKYTDEWHDWERYAKANMLNKAVYSANLFETVIHPTFVYWNKDTLNTPRKAELTTSSEGFAICCGSEDGNQIIFAMAMGTADIFAFYRNNGNGRWIRK